MTDMTDNEGKQKGDKYLNALLIIGLPAWVISGGWIGWSTGGVIVGIAGAFVGGVLFLIGVGMGGVHPKNAESFVFDILMIGGAPVGAIASFILFGMSIIGILVGMIVGMLAGAIVGFMITALLEKYYPQWAPEVEQRVRDKSKLEKYFAEMKELNLQTDAPNSTREEASELTLSILPSLHGEARWKVLSFLKREGLIRRDSVVVDLCGADLTKQTHWEDIYDSDLSGADLRQASFPVSAGMSDVDLSGADLRQARLSSCALIRVNLSGADLREANLSNAYLDGANFRKAKLEGTNLVHASFDHETLWPEGFDPVEAGARLSVSQ